MSRETEHPDHQRLEDQEGDHVFEDALLDRLPGRGDADRHQEGGQQDEQDGDAVHAHAVVEAGEPGRLFDELEAGVVRVELGDQQHRERQGRERGDQRDPLATPRSDFGSSALPNRRSARMPATPSSGA